MQGESPEFPTSSQSAARVASRALVALPSRSKHFSPAREILGGSMATATVAVGTMKVAQIVKPGTGFQIVEREIPNPDAGQVRIKVQACGVCHSDVLVVEGGWP